MLKPQFILPLADASGKSVLSVAIGAAKGASGMEVLQIMAAAEELTEPSTEGGAA